MNWIRRIAPWMLLVAYLPMVTLSSVHIHHDTIDVHDDCLRCVGHFEPQHNHDSDCQFCHFLGLIYFGQDMEQPVVSLPVMERFHLSACEPMVLLRYGVGQTRAPPAEIS